MFHCDLDSTGAEGRQNKTRSAANDGNSTTVFDAVNSDPKGGQKAARFPKLRGPRNPLFFLQHLRTRITDTTLEGTGQLRWLGVCLQLTARSQGPDMEPEHRLLAQPRTCFPLPQPAAPRLVLSFPPRHTKAYTHNTPP